MRSCSSTKCTSVGKIRNGPILELICQAKGEPVTIGQDQTEVWNKVRLTNGVTGYVTNMAVVETPLDFDPSLPRCGGPGGASVYFAPRDIRQWFGLDGFDTRPPGVILNRDDWSDGSCRSISGTHFPAMDRDRRVTTLAGWSLGRLGPTFIFTDDPSRQSEIRYVLLLDPGTLEEYSGPCDRLYDQNALYAQWLGQRSSNRLVIMAGRVTIDRDSGGTFQGIKQKVLQQIRGTQLASQVLVCAYDLRHVAMLDKFAYLTAQPPPTECPRQRGDHFLRRWIP